MNLPAPVMSPTTASDWELVQPYAFDWGASRFIARRGWRTDGASIPRMLWRVLGHPFTGDLLPAALPHDVLYGTHYTTRAEADRLFYDRLLANGVNRAKAWALYTGVRMGGWAAWRAKNREEIATNRHLVEVQIGVRDETVKPDPDAFMGDQLS